MYVVSMQLIAQRGRDGRTKFSLRSLSRFTAPRGPLALWSSQKQDRTHGVRKEEKGAQESEENGAQGLKIFIRDTINNMYGTYTTKPAL